MNGHLGIPNDVSQPIRKKQENLEENNQKVKAKYCHKNYPRLWWYIILYVSTGSWEEESLFILFKEY